MTIPEMFESFFFDAGITGLLALIILFMITLGLLLAWKYSGLITMIILTYMMYEYSIRISVSGELAWNMVIVAIMMLISVFRLAGIGWN